jgi:thiol-disulfide isomerase/thioredoxin
MMLVVQIVVAVLAVAFITFTIATQLTIAARVRSMQGKPVPALPGALGARVTESPRALVYFHSPGCAACRPITPRMRALREKNGAVFVVDVMEDLDVARALGVLATPSTIEIDGGKVVGFHVGRVPDEVLARFA